MTISKMFLLLLGLYFTAGQAALGQWQPAQERDRSLVLDAIQLQRAGRVGTSQLAVEPTLPNIEEPRVLPEWTPADSVVFALDRDFLSSLRTNEQLKTFKAVPGLDDPDFRTRLSREICLVPKLAGVEAVPEGEDADRLQRVQETLRDLDRVVDANCDGGRATAQALRRAHNRLLLVHDLLEVLGELPRHVPVLILIDGDPDSEAAVDVVRNRLGQFPRGEPLTRLENVRFMQLPLDSKWVRDYGPFFVKDSHGRIQSVDTRYTFGQEEESSELEQTLLSLINKSKRQNDNSRNRDERAPSEISLRLRQFDNSRLFSHPLGTLRPPITMSGGDFSTDGMGTVFTSTQTLRDNGGNLSLLNASLKLYFGATHIVYLHPLPGRTVKHLDMFFQPLSESVFLLGYFPQKAGAPISNRLQQEAAQTLNHNLRILTDHYEGLGRRVRVVRSAADELNPAAVNIVLVPMPPVLRPFLQQGTDLLREVQLELQQVADYEQRLRTLDRLQELLGGFGGAEEVLDAVIFFNSQQGELDGDDYNSVQSIRNAVSGISETAGALAPDAPHHSDLFQALSKIADPLIRRIEEIEATEHTKQKPALGAALESLRGPIQNVQTAANDLTAALADERAKWTSILTDSKRELETAVSQLEELRKSYGSADVYRTYLNLLQVKRGDKTIVLVPSYSGGDVRTMEQEAYSLLEGILRKATGSSYSLLKVPSDRFIEMFGSVHCLTKVIPESVVVLDQRWREESENSRAGSAPQGLENRQ